VPAKAPASRRTAQAAQVPYPGRAAPAYPPAVAPVSPQYRSTLPPVQNIATLLLEKSVWNAEQLIKQHQRLILRRNSNRD